VLIIFGQALSKLSKKRFSKFLHLNKLGKNIEKNFEQLLHQHSISVR